MDLFQYGTDPWGQEIIIRLAWGLLTLSFWAGIGFVVFHAVYAVVWKPRPTPPFPRRSCGTPAPPGCSTG